MSTKPIAPVTRRSAQVEEIRETFGIPRPSDRETEPSESRSPAPSQDRQIVHRDVSKKTTRAEYKGLEIIFLTGDYEGEKLFLGTDIVSLSMSQSANWAEKEGQRLRVGLNFTNVSPRQLSFSLDLYDPNGDISHAVENIAHIQEITAAAGNTPPLLLIKVGDTIYQNAVSLSFNPEFSEPLPTITNTSIARSGGFRRAKIKLDFKIGGGKGSLYRNAQPFSDRTELKSILATQTAAKQNKQGSVAVEKILLSQCLTKSENEAFEEALEAGTLTNPEAYLNMSGELFLQLAPAGLPKEVLAAAPFRDRLRREMSVKIAKQQPSGEHTPSQLASALFTAEPLIGYQGDFNALLVQYNAIINAILADNLSQLDTESDAILTKASRCGRGIRDKGGVKLTSAPITSDPVFMLANLRYFGKSTDKVSNAQFKQLLGLGSGVTAEVVKEIRGKDLFATKEEFDTFVGTATDGVTARNAIAAFEENEKKNLALLNEFLATAEVSAIKDRLGISKDVVASDLAGNNYVSKEEFIKAAYASTSPNGTYTASSALSSVGNYWIKFIYGT